MIHNSLFTIQSLHRRLFYLLLFLLPTQLGFHFWPEWAHVLGRRVDYLSPTLYLTDALIISILVIFFVERFLRSRNNARPASLGEAGESGIMGKTRKKFSLSSFIIHNSRFIILLIFAATNIWFAASPPVALYTWVKVVEFALLAWYIIKTKPRLNIVIAMFFLSTLYASILAIIQFSLQHSVGGFFWLLGERTFAVETPGIARTDVCVPFLSSCRLLLRPYATFPHPNVLGGYIAVLIPLFLYGYSLNKISLSHVKRPVVILLWWVAFFLCLTALFLTFSRSAWVVGGIAIALTMARIMKYARPVSRGETRESGIMKSALRVTFVLFMILCLLFIIQAMRTIRQTDESVVRRIELNKEAIVMWRHSPIIGVGLGNFVTVLPEISDKRQINFLQPVHNIYLLLLSEIGVVGIGLFAFIIFHFLNHARPASLGEAGELGIMNKDKKMRVRMRFSMIHISLFMILLLGFVDHYPLTLQQGQLLLTILSGLSLASSVKDKQTKEL